MPLFEYECRRCGLRIELIQRYSDPPPAACDSCGGELKKLLSAPAVHFKGSGWYVTDYARKGVGTEAKPGGSESVETKPGSATSAGSKAGDGSSGDSKASGKGDRAGAGKAAAAGGKKSG